ncbi:MFS transporter [Paenibacillus soyae]|uniref:MFS transporter n=1 Tax=Paenibacillus soyae TaxID=2969249 RepID=A0A9X2MLA3_9BACL|nr:MFS transporter [Paenibacillus soyae]MCR2802689.1 MFS transporter [Paenibacillus soyae]
MSGPASEGGRQQRLGLLAMYLDTLCMAIGFYMLIPLLSIYTISHMGWSPAIAGIIVAISGLSQQGLRFVSGIIAEKIGYKQAILLGVGIRIAGYVLFGLAQVPAGFMLAAFIAGVGGSLFHPASYAVYAVLTEKEGRSKIYAMREMLSNLGFILGPVMGMFLLSIDFKIVCFSSAAMFLLAWILTYYFVPNIRKSERKEGSSPSVRAMLSTVFRDKPFIRFNLVALVLWSLSVQLYLIVPIRAEQLMLDVSKLAYLYTAAAVFMVILQLPIHIGCSKVLSGWRMLSIGAFFLASGYLIIGFASGIWMLLGGILIFTLGQIFFVPKMNEMTSGFADEQSFALYFGFSGFFLAAGGFLGNSLTGLLQEIALQMETDFKLPWIISAFIGFSTAIFIWLKTLKSKARIKEEQA